MTERESAEDSLSGEAPLSRRRPHVADDGTYFNPWPDHGDQYMSAAFAWWIARQGLGNLLHPPDRALFPCGVPDPARPGVAHGALAVTWIGHSSLLLQLGGVNALTDPIWSERASPVSFSGPARWVPPGLALDALPAIDLILISHNHYDHLDEQTVRQLTLQHPDAAWVTPLGLAGLLRTWGVANVTELDWWQSLDVRGASVRALPARHFSARGIGDRGRTLWCSWSVSAGGVRAYFGGDTAIHPEFAVIGHEAGPFDLIAMPIGAYAPRRFMRAVHMDPDEAVEAYLSLTIGARRDKLPPLVPIHWGTFKLTDEPMTEPPTRAGTVWARAQLPADRLWLLRHGETRRLDLSRHMLR